MSKEKFCEKKREEERKKKHLWGIGFGSLHPFSLVPKKKNSKRRKRRKKREKEKKKNGRKIEKK